MRASNQDIVSNQLASDDFGSPLHRSRIARLATCTALGFGILTASAILAPSPVYAVCAGAFDVVCDGPAPDNTESFTFFGSVTYQNGETQGTGKGLSLDDGNVNFAMDATSSITATDDTGAAVGSALKLSTTNGSITSNALAAIGINGKLSSTLGFGLEVVNTAANGNITIDQGAASSTTGELGGVYLEVASGNIKYTGNGFVGGNAGHAISAYSTSGGNITITTTGELSAPTAKMNGIDARSFGTTGAVTVTASGPIGSAGTRIGNAGIAAATFDAANPANVAVTTNAGADIYATRFGIDAENYGTGTTTVISNAKIDSNGVGIYAGTVAPISQPGLVTVTANADVAGTLYGIRTRGSGGIVIDGTGAISSASGTAIRAFATDAGGITINQTGDITGSTEGISLVADSGNSDVTISSKLVAAGGTGVLGASNSGNITVSVLSTGSIDPLVGVDLSTVSGALTTNNAGLIEGDNIGVRQISTGAGAVGNLTVAQTGTGAINGKAQQGVVLSSLDANLAVTGTGTTTINGGTIGVDAQSNGAGNVTVTGNVITGGTGGVLAKTATGSVTVDGTGGISTVAGTAVDMAITGAGSAGTISYTRNGAVTGDAGISALSAGAGDVTIAPVGNILANNGNAINAQLQSAGAGNGAVKVTTVGGTVDATGGSGIIAYNALAGSGGVSVINAATATAVGGFGIDARNTNAASTGNLSVSTSTAVSGSTGGIVAANSGSGLATVITGAGLVSSSGGQGVQLIGTDGNATATIGAGGVTSTSSVGVNVASNGAGNVLVNGTGLVTGVSRGIAATQSLGGGLGSVTVTGGLSVVATNAGGIGIDASIANAANGKNILIDISGTVNSAGSGIQANTVGSGNITIAPGADVTGSNGFAVKAVNSNVAANVGTIAVTQAGGTLFSASTDGIVTDSGLSTGLTTVTVNGTVTAGQYGIKGNSTAGDIVTNVAAASTVSGLAGVGQDTVSGAITLGNAGAISGDLAGVTLHSTGAGAVGALTVAQTGTGSITSKSGPGIVSDTVDANFIVSGNGATTTITGGTFGIDLASSGNSNITITDNTITGGTGGGVLAHTVGGGILVNGTGNITTTTGKAVDLYLSGSSANTNSILYTRTGDVLGEGGIITQIKNGSGNITIAPVGNITATNGSGIVAQQSDVTAAAGNVLVTTLAGNTISTKGGVGIAAVNGTLGAGTVTVNNAAALKVSGTFGIIAVRNSASSGDVIVTNSGAITSGLGGINTLGTGIQAVANGGANGNVSVTLTKGGDIGSAADRAQTFGIQAISVSGANTGNVAVTLTDTSVFSVGHAVNAQNIGKGNVTVTGTGAGTISSSGGLGINAVVSAGNPGNVTVKVAQDVLGFTGGINAITNGAGKVSVTAHNVSTTNGTGINATTIGTGAVEVLADGIILSGTGTGVNATINNAANANDLNVKLAAGSVTGTKGIVAQILAGTGSVNVTALTVTGTAGNAIDAEQQSTAVSNGAVTVTTTAGSPITATGGSGIVALNSLKGSGDVTVLSNAVINVSGGNGISATRNNGSGNIVITSNAAISGSTAGGLGVGILGALGPNSTGNATANVNADVGTAGNPALFSGVALSGAVGTTGSLNINVNNVSVYGTNAGVTGQQNGQGNVTILGTGPGTISASTGGAVIGRIIGAGAGNVLVDVTQIAIGKTSGLLGITGGTGNVVINSHAAVTATGGNGVVAVNNNVAANAGTLTVTQDAGTLISATGGNGILTNSGLSTGLTLINVNGEVTAPGFTGVRGTSTDGGITVNVSATGKIDPVIGVDLATTNGPLIVNNAGSITGDNLGVQMIATGSGSITLNQTGTGKINGTAIAGINTDAGTGNTLINLAAGTTVTGKAGITSAVSGGSANVTINVNSAIVTATNGAGITVLGSSICCFGTGQEVVNLTGTAQVLSRDGDGISITRNEDLGLSAVNITGTGAKVIANGIGGSLSAIRVDVIDGDGAGDTGNGSVTTGDYTLVSVAAGGGNNNNGIYVSNGGAGAGIGGSSTITTGFGNIIDSGHESGSGNIGLRATSLAGASTVNGGGELYLFANGANATGILTSTGTGNNTVALTSGTITLLGGGTGAGISASNATGGTTTVNTGTTKITVTSGTGILTNSGSANGATSITSGGLIRTTAGAGISAALTNAVNPGAVAVLSNAAIQASGGNGIEVTNAGLGGTTVTSNALISSGGAGAGTLLSGIVINGTGTAGDSTVNLNANIGSAADVASVNGIVVNTGAGTGGVFINANGTSIWSSSSAIQTAHGGDGGATILGTGTGVISSANASGVSSVGSGAGNIRIDLAQTITGKTSGINAATSGTGNITVNTRNTVTATAGSGIIAANTNAAANTGKITINQAAGMLISATGGNGIQTDSGVSTGLTAINVNGPVTSSTASGVVATSNGGGVTIAQAVGTTITAAVDAIKVNNGAAGGAITVNALGTLFASNGSGVFVNSASTTADPITVTTNIIKSTGGAGTWGSQVRASAGSGEIVINSNGAITSATAPNTIFGGILALTNGTSNRNVTVNVNADIGTPTDLSSAAQVQVSGTSSSAKTLAVNVTNASIYGGPGAIKVQQSATSLGDIRIIGTGTGTLSATKTGAIAVNAGILNAANSGNILVDVTQNVVGDVAGIFANSVGSGNVTVNAKGDVTAANGVALFVRSSGAVAGNGAVTVTTAAGKTITATGDRAIYADNFQTGNGGITINSNAAIKVSVGSGTFADGIFAGSLGTGAVTINSNAKIGSGTGGAGTFINGIVIAGVGTGGDRTVNLNADIGAAADRATGNGINIATTATTGAVNVNITGSSVYSIASAVVVGQNGNGGVNIIGTGAGLISSTNANGILANTIAGSGNTLIDVTQDITGKTAGISASTSGAGNITILAKSNVTATAGGAISALNTNAAVNASTITVTQSAGKLISATGGNGITTNSGKSTGATTINVNAEVSAPGQIGVKATSTAGNIALNVSSAGKITPVIAADMATVTGAMSVANAGILSGDVTAIKMVATGTGSGSVTNSGTITAATNTVLGTLAGGAFTINNSGTLNGGVSVSGSDVAGSTFTNTATGVWNNAANTSTYSGNFVNAGLDNIAAGGSQLFSGSSNNSNRITFAAAGTFTTNGAMTNTGIINALNGVTANNQVVVGGSYVGGGQFQVDANTATALADTMRIGGTASGATNVVLNVLGKGFMPSGFLPIVTVTGGAPSTAFTSAYPFPLTGLLLESFGQNPSTNTQFGIIQRINTNVAQMGSLSTIAGSVSSFLDQPASEYVTAKTDPSAGDHQIGLWIRGGGGDDNQNLTTAVSTGGVTYSTSTRRVSTSFRNLQAGLDYGMLNMGGNGWNAHLGITGGIINADARESGINTHLDTNFIGGYIFVSNGAFTLDATLRHESRTYKLVNPSMFGSSTPVQTKGGSTAGAVSASYRVNFGNGLAFTPLAAVSFGNSSIDPFVVDSTTTFTPGSDHRSLGRAGGQLSYKSTAASGFTVEPYAGVYALKNFSNTELSSVRFSATTTTTFNTLSTAYRNAVLYNVGIKAGSPTGKLTGFVEGNFRSGSGLGGGAVNMGIRLNF